MSASVCQFPSQPHDRLLLLWCSAVVDGSRDTPGALEDVAGNVGTDRQRSRRYVATVNLATLAVVGVHGVARPITVRIVPPSRGRAPCTGRPRGSVLRCRATWACSVFVPAGLQSNQDIAVLPLRIGREHLS